MSLDVYLRSKDVVCEQCGARHTCCEPMLVFEANITHNLGEMAADAGLYKCLWRPDEIGITKAAQLVEPLRLGLAQLRGDRKRYEKLNPENGWGYYDGLVGFVERYLTACLANPEADISVSR